MRLAPNFAKPSQARTDATEARLSGLALPESGAWGRAARQDALDRLREMGLPQPRDEYWRMTNPRPLNGAQAEAADLMADDEAPIWGETGALRIVFRDGVFDAAASDDLSAIEGVRIERLADAMAGDIHWAKDLYGALESRGQSPVPRPFAALNTATATDGVVIDATAAASRAIRVVYERSDEGADPVLHSLVRVAPGAEVTLLESGAGGARINTVLEADIADGGRFHHVRMQGRDPGRRAVTHSFARLGAEAAFKSFTLTMNGFLTRNEQVVEFTGDDAIAHVAGACVGDGRDFHHDDTVFVTHDALRCESRQVFKKVLKNGATGVFQGKILVKAGAQKTDGYQISQSLLLDDDSQFLAKPELEIYADDVACSHGSTTGAIDPTALFYLRSRGVPEAEAQDLMVLAFLAEALEEIEDGDLAEELRVRLEGWLARRAG
ncbi:SufB/SufD family protein [Wenxinia saemankumensis]|uniref:Fe-S cluster assembly protein SufD n=1 Tax=Wenxinia saemankumensis TaxID=1447782 RepID=A0A1M6H3K7_9RHOB|nr:SufD family Fe-S cluster assembly protein [Wenxinia saemankumensis]SHJ16763.1 Fe-S cluster assembly protein SufD [Wenxinia saemankumensis]